MTNKPLSHITLAILPMLVPACVASPVDEGGYELELEADTETPDDVQTDELEQDPASGDETRSLVSFRELPAPHRVERDGDVEAMVGAIAEAPEGFDTMTDDQRDASMQWAARVLVEELSSGFDVPPGAVTFTGRERIEDGTVVLRAEQLWDDVPVLGSDLTFVFRDGNLVAYAGQLLPRRAVLPTAMRHEAEIRGRLQPQLSDYIAELDEFELARDETPVDLARELDAHLEVRRVVDPETSTVIWKASLPGHEWTVDEQSLDVSESLPHEHHYWSSSSQPVRHQSISRSNWRNSLDTTTNPATTSNSVSLDMDVQGGLCIYNLQRDISYSNGISPRVQDWDSSEFVVPLACGQSMNGLPCGLSFDCQPNQSSGNLFRQQHYFYYLRRARIQAGTAFGYFAPNSNWDVGLEIDRAPGACGNTGSTACFSYNPWSRWIFLTRNGNVTPSVATLFHEFGHFFNWSYGGISENCKNGDEGNAVDETLADSIGNLLGLRELSSVRYNQGIGTPYYGTTDFPEVVIGGAFGCNLYGDEHYMGRGFTQAIWQIAFGADCDEVACSGNMTGVRGDIGWASQAQATEQLLRAIAYAEKILPPGQTHSQVASFIHLYLMMYTNPSIASQAAQVFQTHGLL